MILGIGVDLVEVERIEQSIARHGERFLQRVFTDSEIAYCSPMKGPGPHYAARFAAKEALAKAFGTGISTELGWLDIEVRRKASPSSNSGARLQSSPNAAASPPFF
jgi:holo-[acyl-carrier protein] synthase